MAQLVATIEGLAEACAFFDAPITGGNVSLYNETLGDPVFPSPVLGIVGMMQTVLPPGIAFRDDGHDIVLIGGVGAADETRMGGTQYAKQVLQRMWGLPPIIDLDFEKRVHDAVREIVVAGLAETAHDLSDGGLAWALAESTFKAGIGATIALDSGLRSELLLFHEGPSRVLVSTSELSRVLEICERHRVPAPVIGRTGSARLRIENRGDLLIDARVSEVKGIWSTALESALHAESHV
jgi:phosphoribosylformylglycinamidine synthase